MFFNSKTFKLGHTFYMVCMAREIFTPTVLLNLVPAFKFLTYLLSICSINLTWLPFILIILSNDVPTNPGPNIYKNGLSFCTWNINSLLEAHNSIFNYDMIFLSETSLNNKLDIPDKLLDGYKFHVSNHPSGLSRNSTTNS